MTCCTFDLSLESKLWMKENEMIWEEKEHKKTTDRVWRERERKGGKKLKKEGREG